MGKQSAEIIGNLQHQKAMSRKSQQGQDPRAASLGARIAHVRMMKKESQDRFATVVGCGRDSLRKYENGGAFPSVEVIYNIAEKYQVDLHWLLTGNSNPVRFGMLVESIEAVEEILKKKRKKLNPGPKAILIFSLYEDLARAQTEAEEEAARENAEEKAKKFANNIT